VVSADGDLYTWGEADGGKLGLAGGPDEDTDYPRQVLNQLELCKLICA
jgi:alpha-tubulin suppressor-like RCC1 family protein